MIIYSDKKGDLRREKILTNFLEKYFFNTEAFSINYNQEKQYKGIDAIFEGKKIDFKGQTSKRFMGNPSESFVLELYFTDRNGNIHLGWFIDPEKETDYYGFCWVHKGTFSPFVVEEVEYMQVDVKKLKEAVFNIVPKETIIKFAEDNYGSEKGMYISKDIYLKSMGYIEPEKPLNLIVSKEFYKQFAVCHEYIKGDKV